MQVLKIQLNSLKAFISINCVLYGRMRFNVEKKEIEKLHEDLKSSFKIMHWEKKDFLTTMTIIASIKQNNVL